jgi:endonuclease/exonuclease/phosphatase family metal-dependent hydrolase
VKTLRFCTLNIWNREGPWEARRKAIREQIEALSPDVVAMQEVLAISPEGGRETQAEQILEGLGWHFAYATGHEVVPGLFFGNALASPHPIRDEERIALPGADRSDQERCLLGAVVDTPLGPLHAFSTHLNWKHHEGAIRLAQAIRIADAIEERCPRGEPLPPVLMGDFNAEPDSDAIRFLSGLSVVEGRSVHFADAWSWTNNQNPGHTLDPVNTFAARLDEPARRVDYVFVRCDESGPRGKPQRARLAFDMAVDGVYPSDHFGVVADVRYG